MSRPLEGRTVALAEGRQLEELAGLLQQEGAAVLRCPMLSILDAPDAAAALAWLGELIAGQMGLLVLGLQQSAVWGWGNAETWICIIAGLALMVAFIRAELRTPHPLLRIARQSDSTMKERRCRGQAAARLSAAGGPLERHGD